MRPTSTARPPRLARALVHICLRGEAREVIAGDLAQEFAEHLAAGVPSGAAGRRYWRQAVASIVAVRRPRREDRVATTLAGWRPWRGLALDVRSVARALGRSPGYAATAILSLAIGIGANTAVVSVIGHLLFEPLPVDRPEELRLLYWAPNSDAPLSISQLNSTGYRDASGVFYRSNYTYAELGAMREAVGRAADISAFVSIRQVTTSDEGRASVMATGLLVSGNFFRTIRPRLELGRALTDADDRASAAAVAVLGHTFWTRVFGSDRNVIGKTIELNGTPVVVVGVTAAGYRGLSPSGFAAETDVTLPLASQPAITPEWQEKGRSLFTEPSQYWLRVMARVPPGADGVVTETLQTTLRRTMVDGGLTGDQAARVTPRLFPGARGLDSLRVSTLQPLRVLSVVVGVVLLIACINVAGLMLARGVRRQRELAVRRALGAGRFRIMRELLLESVILAAAGGLAGLLLAIWSAPVMEAMLSAGLGTRGVGVTIDWRLFAGTAALSGTAAVLAGLLPAIRFSRPQGSMLNDRTGGSGAPKLTAGRALLALQIAVSLPLVVGAGLFLRTLHNLNSVDLGFNPRGLTLFTVDPTMNGRARERAAAVFPRLLERLESIPGVTSATLVENALVSGWESDTTIQVNGQKGHMYLNAVGPHYFETMGVALLSGRAIEPTDGRQAPPVVVINQAAARLYFGGASLIGRRFKVGAREVEIVGVAADSKYDDLRSGVEPTMLQSYLQRQIGSMHVAVRSAAPDPGLRKAIERAVEEVDRAMPITGFKTQDEQITETIGKERVFTRLLTVFGGFALLLASIGLYGVTSYSVARRTAEIGIRLALGAQRTQVLWLVLRQVVTLAVAGLAIGVPAAWLAGPAVRSFLFELEPNDPVTIAASAAVMFGVAIGAGLWPARRASRLDAQVALRSE